MAATKAHLQLVHNSETKTFAQGWEAGFAVGQRCVNVAFFFGGVSFSALAGIVAMLIYLWGQS